VEVERTRSVDRDHEIPRGEEKREREQGSWILEPDKGFESFTEKAGGHCTSL